MSARIGDILVARGVASAAQVRAALASGRGRHTPLASRLLEAGVREGGLAAALAERLGTPGVDLSRTTIALEALSPVPREVAEQDLILPLSLEGGRLHLAMAHPLDARVVAEVRFVTGLEVSAYAAVQSALERAIGAAYDARARGEAAWRGVAGGALAQVEAVLPSPAAGPPTPGAGEEDPAAAPGRDAEEAPGPVVARTDRRPLALVVDDEPEIRQLVRRALEARGWAVELASDGEAALARAEALLPDVVLLDAMLPRVHGFEACRRLRSAPRTRGVPVVIMTAVYRGWRFAQDAREHLGAHDYLEKPFRIEDLVRRLESARGQRAAPLPAAAAPAGLARGRAMLAEGRVAEAARSARRRATIPGAPTRTSSSGARSARPGTRSAR